MIQLTDAERARFKEWLMEQHAKNLTEGQKVRPDFPSKAFDLIDLSQSQKKVAENL